LICTYKNDFLLYSENGSGSQNRALHEEDEFRDSVAFKSLLTEEDFDDEVLYESPRNLK